MPYDYENTPSDFPGGSNALEDFLTQYLANSQRPTTMQSFNPIHAFMSLFAPSYAKWGRPADRMNDVPVQSAFGNPGYGNIWNRNVGGQNAYHRGLMSIQDEEVPGIDPRRQSLR